MKKEFCLKLAKRNSLRILIIALLFIASNFLTGCEKKSIDDDTAVKIYVEKLIAEESHSLNPDSLRIQIQNVFLKYNTTQQQFDDYMNNLADNPDKLEEFFKDADKYLIELNKNGIVK